MRLRCVSHIHVYGAQFPGQSIHFKMTLQRKSFTNCDLKLVVSASGCYIHTQITIYIHILYYQFTRLYRIMYFCHERKDIPFHLHHCGAYKCDLCAHFPQNDDAAKMLILDISFDYYQKPNYFHHKMNIISNRLDFSDMDERDLCYMHTTRYITPHIVINSPHALTHM